MREEDVTHSLKVPLTDVEMLTWARTLAKASGDLDNAKDQKKEAMTKAAARIQKYETLLAEATRVVNNGYLHRDVACKLVYDHPEPGLKTTIRTDDWSEVETVRMTPDDMQTTFKFHQRRKDQVIELVPTADTAAATEAPPEGEAQASHAPAEGQHDTNDTNATPGPDEEKPEGDPSGEDGVAEPPPEPPAEGQSDNNDTNATVEPAPAKTRPIRRPSGAPQD